MRQLFIQRAIFNKNTNNMMISYLETITFEKLIEERNGCTFGSIKENNSLFDLFTHIVLCECMLYQKIYKSGVISSYVDELLQYPLPKPLIMKRTKENFNEAIELLRKLDLAIIKLYKNIDFNSYNIDDFSKKESFKDNTPVVFMEQLFVHGIHHRAQISQILSELGIGEDFSRFQKFGVFD